MATGNLFLGTARRKLGDVVLSRRNGKQVARIRVTPRNPRTSGQLISRLALSSAAKTACALSKVVTHSFQGVTYGQKSVNHFVRAATKQIRASMLEAIQKGSAAYPYGCAPVIPFAAAGVGAPVPVVISSGDLKGLDCGWNVSEAAYYVSQSVDAGWNRLNFTEANFGSVFGVSLECQLTFVQGLVQQLDYIDPEQLMYAARYEVIRVNFKQPTSTVLPLFIDVSESESTLNPNIIDMERSDPRAASIVFYQNGGRLYIKNNIVGTQDDPAVSAVIVSKYEAGKWRRSFSKLELYPTQASSAVAIQQDLAYNDVQTCLDLAANSRAVAEDRFLNKEKN